MYFLSLIAIVHVLGASAQSITKPPIDITECMGSSVDIDCVYSNSVNLTVIWIINDIEIPIEMILTDPTYGYFGSYDMSTQMGNYSLRINAINRTTDFQCRLNVGGTPMPSEARRVTVAGPPSPVGNIAFSAITCKSITVSWQNFTSDSVCGTLYYNVTLFSSNGPLTRMTDSNVYLFPDLESSTDYSVTVIGVNSAGYGDIIEGMDSTMSLLTMPSGTVRDVMIDVNNLTITVEWDPPYDDDDDCVVNLTYYVTISSRNGMETVNISDTSHTFENVANNTRYTIVITATINRINGTDLTEVVVVGKDVDGEDDGGDDDNTGAIIGGAVGGTFGVTIIVVIAIGGGVFYYKRQYKIHSGPSMVGTQDTEKTPSPANEPVATNSTDTKKKKPEKERKPPAEPANQGGITYADLNIGKGPAAPGSIFPQDRPTYGQVKPSN